MGRAAVLLMGPTGAGKSDLALRLVERFPLEIISVDSALVYRGMDIGTAKPSALLRARHTHHLIDIRDPAQQYSAGEFVRDALAAMQDIWSRGRLPLLVGGTMLYFHALTAGIADLPEADMQVRADIDAAAAANGWDAVHRTLAQVDPAAAARIHSNDAQRIQRALEVYRVTGQRITDLQRARHTPLADVNLQEIALIPGERSQLHARIAERFEAMLEQGLLDEVRGFFVRGDLTGEHPAMRAVGYRQIWEHLAGACSLEEAQHKALAATRQLAKRQLTWLRQRPRVAGFDCLHPDVAGSLVDALRKGIFAEWS
ncbi:MAG TPA: tRNA (adenosine(37)-N6)-dimethylallyltransferase MiaA [Steroidobacteraceae bacterium]|nr:tRNA (adenosine(37)-N6)-dimethylallyltransferase MiaA [Steroidobacteraceae bacterium]